MKNGVIFFVLLLCGAATDGFAQLTYENCLEKVKANYPLVKRYELIEFSEEYNLANAVKGYLPQVSFSAKATWQSEVTRLPVALPGVQVEGLNKDQYQVVADVQQVVWDGGRIREQKKQVESNTESDRQQQNVDMYTLNERTQQLFFGVLLLEEQLMQNLLLQQDLQRNYELIMAYVANGVANDADVDAVKVEQLSAIQRFTELITTCRAYSEVLAAMMGDVVPQKQLAGMTESVPDCVRPAAEMVAQAPEMKRPELDLLDAHKNQYDVQLRMLTARNRPQFGLFLQGGYGNPGLNMLKNDFSPWFMGGVRFSWNFGSLYTLKSDKRLLQTGREGVDVQRETFLFNTRLQVVQENGEIHKIRELMRHDDEIIALRSNILKSAEVKVANGTLSVTELLREINAGEQARQSKLLHDIQLLIAIYSLKNTTNN